MLNMKNSDTKSFFPITESRSQANSSTDIGIPATSPHASSRARTPALPIPSDSNDKSLPLSFFQRNSLAHSMLKPPSPIARELAIEEARTKAESLDEINPIRQSNESSLPSVSRTVVEPVSRQSQSIFKHSKDCLTQALEDPEELKCITPCSADDAYSDSELMFDCDL